MIHFQIITYSRAMSILDSLLARSRRISVKSPAKKVTAQTSPITPTISKAPAVAVKAPAVKTAAKKSGTKKPAVKKAATKKAATKK